MYDLIGDIHGHADELRDLLENQLKYNKKGGVYSHSKRRAIFLGDFIDRGPKIRQVLEIVRPMIDSGEAKAVMGNHEFNALAYHTPLRDQPGEYLRPHVFFNEKTGRVDPKNLGQHLKTLKQVPDAELHDYLEWFRTLPLWLELKDGNGSPLRVAHAAWDDRQIQMISECIENSGGVTTGFLAEASRKGSRLYEAIECVLKAPELRLPGEKFITDKDGNKRREIRTQWYREPGYEEETYSQYALPPLLSDSEKITRRDFEKKVRSCRPYPEDAPPLFIGHYWLRGEPELLTPNIACVDYSIARGGSLCAYRWDGEQKLDIDKFESVPAPTCAHLGPYAKVTKGS